MAYPSDKQCWSSDIYSLIEIPDKIELPTLVRVTEGIYTTQDCSTFSQGDIIRIDSCETVEMVGAHLALLKDGCFQPQGNELYVPLNYKGRVRVCSTRGSCHQYTSIEELITYFPKFVKISKRLYFTDEKGQMCMLKANDTIELLKLVGSKQTGATGLLVRQNKSKIILPKGLTSLFVDVDFTIKDVMKFRMPQYIRFLGQDINMFTSKDIQEAAANIDHYDGYLMLTGKRRNRTVLVGHYKPLEKDPSSVFCRRSAVILPMDNPDTANIQVQVPIYMDVDDYEVFVLKHFSESDVSQSIEGLLYIEFSKNPSVTFLKDPSTSPPVVPPRSDRSVEELSSQAPIFPLKPSAHSEHQLQDNPKPTQQNQPVQLPHRQMAPNQRGTGAVVKDNVGTSLVGRGEKKKNAAGKDASVAGDVSGLIGDIFSGFSDNVDDKLEDPVTDSPVTQENAEVEPKKNKGFLHNIKKKFVHKSHVDTKEEGSRREEECEGTVYEPVYDYVDKDSLLCTHARQLLEKTKSGAQDAEKDTKAKTAVIHPFQQVDEEITEKTFKNLSIDELRTCFERCALNDLAHIVTSQKLDGQLFSYLSDDDLKKEPMFLNNLDIKKVRLIQKGWRPNDK